MPSRIDGKAGVQIIKPTDDSKTFSLIEYVAMETAKEEFPNTMVRFAVVNGLSNLPEWKWTKDHVKFKNLVKQPPLPIVTEWAQTAKANPEPPSEVLGESNEKKAPTENVMSDLDQPIPKKIRKNDPKNAQEEPKKPKETWVFYDPRRDKRTPISRPPPDMTKTRDGEIVYLKVPESIVEEICASDQISGGIFGTNHPTKFPEQPKPQRTIDWNVEETKKFLVALDKPLPTGRGTRIPNAENGLWDKYKTVPKKATAYKNPHKNPKKNPREYRSKDFNKGRTNRTPEQGYDKVILEKCNEMFAELQKKIESLRPIVENAKNPNAKRDAAPVPPLSNLSVVIQHKTGNPREYEEESVKEEEDGQVNEYYAMRKVCMQRSAHVNRMRTSTHSAFSTPVNRTRSYMPLHDHDYFPYLDYAHERHHRVHQIHSFPIDDPTVVIASYIDEISTNVYREIPFMYATKKYPMLIYLYLRATFGHSAMSNVGLGTTDVVKRWYRAYHLIIQCPLPNPPRLTCDLTDSDSMPPPNSIPMNRSFIVHAGTVSLPTSLQDDEVSTLHGIVDELDQVSLPPSVAQLLVKTGETTEESSVTQDDRKVCYLNKHSCIQAINKILEDQDGYEHAYIDNGSDTTSIGGHAWYIISKSEHKVTVVGYHQDHSLKDDLSVGTAVTAVELPDDTIILIRVAEAILLGPRGSTLLSVTQMREYGVIVEETPRKYGGLAYIQVDDVVIPLSLTESMLSFKIRLPTKYELENCEVIDITSEGNWEPKQLNESQCTKEEYYQLLSQLESKKLNLKRAFKQVTDLSVLEKFFLYPGNEVMEKTLENTTQLGLAEVSRLPMRQHFKAINPLLSRRRINEAYATDTWFSTVTSYEGYNCAQVFYGISTRMTSHYGMTSESHGPDALLDFFRQEGVPLSILRDNSKMQTSLLWDQYMRRYWVKDKYIEPYHSQQNPAERQMAFSKEKLERLFIETGCDPRVWFRAACHVADIHNHTASKVLGYRTPYEMQYGHTPDITGLLQFQF